MAKGPTYGESNAGRETPGDRGQGKGGRGERTVFAVQNGGKREKR